MVVCTYGGHGHHQWQHHRSKPTTSDCVEPKQLGHVLDLEARVDARDTHEDGIGNPVDCHESADKTIIFD